MSSRDPQREFLRERLKKLGLHGVLSRFEELAAATWLGELVGIEENDRVQRGMERRVRRSKIGAFKPLANFDWAWPKRIDREAIEDLFSLSFLEDAANVVLVGPNGVGKTTIAQNLAHAALLKGHGVLRVNASDLLTDLSKQDTSTALQRRLRRYTQPALLVVDELGYLTYDVRLGDLMFEVIHRRHERRSTVITTNLPFAEWNRVFPNSSCVTAMIDRLVHRAEILTIDGESYRLKEAKDRADRKAKDRAKKKKRKRENEGDAQ